MSSCLFNEISILSRVSGEMSGSLSSGLERRIVRSGECGGRMRSKESDIVICD